MKKCFIGIDPGKSGAIAVIDDNRKILELENFSIYGYGTILREYDIYCELVVIEKVHAMPKQGVASMFNFGENYGIIQGMVYSLGYLHTLVSPQEWKKFFKVTSDKQTSIDRCKEIFKDVNLKRTDRCKKDDDGRAEALLMAEYARHLHHENVTNKRHEYEKKMGFINNE